MAPLLTTMDISDVIHRHLTPSHLPSRTDASGIDPLTTNRSRIDWTARLPHTKMFSAAFKAFSSGIHSSYSVSSSPLFSTGAWSVYSGTKRSSGDHVSVFVFDKKKVMAFATKSGIRKEVVNEILDLLRLQVANLAKFRHPAVLKLIEPLEESKGSMCFVTEPCSSSLKTLIDNSSSGSSSEGFDDLDDIVVQKGLLQVTEGLEFLHQHAQIVHLNINPHSIVVDAKGDWKISGLGFIEPPNKTDFYPPQYDPRFPRWVSIDPNYSAPELILDHRVEASCDTFSLGCLIMGIYFKHAPMKCDGTENYRSEVDLLLRKKIHDPRIPQYLQGIVQRMLTRQPMDRITLHDFRASQFFDNILIRTINFLDEIPQKTPQERQAFMKGLQKVLPQFPNGIRQRKILSALLQELDKDESLVGPILVNILLIGADMSQLGFSEQILPKIVKVKDVLSAQVVILDNLETVIAKLNGSDFVSSILPIILTTMETAPPEIQEKALKRLPLAVEKLDFITLKNDVFPRVGATFAKTTSLSVKLEGLSVLRYLVTSGLDKYTLTEKLLPLLAGMKTREPKVMMGALAVYSELISILDLEQLAKLVIPQLLSMSMESLLNLQQFQEFMAKIRMIIDRIDKDNSKRLHNAVTSEPSTRIQTPIGSSNNQPVDDFEALVYGNNSSAMNGQEAKSQNASLNMSPMDAILPSMHENGNASLSSKPVIQPSFSAALKTTATVPSYSTSQQQTAPTYSSPPLSQANSFSAALQPQNNSFSSALQPQNNSMFTTSTPANTANNTYSSFSSALQPPPSSSSSAFSGVLQPPPSSSLSAFSGVLQPQTSSSFSSTLQRQQGNQSAISSPRQSNAPVLSKPPSFKPTTATPAFGATSTQQHSAFQPLVPTKGAFGQTSQPANQVTWTSPQQIKKADNSFGQFQSTPNYGDNSLI